MMSDPPSTDAAGTAARPAGSKAADLAQAMRRHVEPGCVLHLAGGIGGPGAAIAELLRTFRSRAPGFTIVQSTVCGHALNLVHAGLVKRLVCAVAADISGSARPSRVIQRAIDHGLELENWSLLALQQRLMAGAFGVPLMPTRSIGGSDLERDHAGRFARMPDPFGDGEVGVVRALVPDLSIVHGCIADEDGNTVLAAPAGEDLWGALASRRGVIVTVERIASAAEVRRHAAMVKIPSHRVLAVCAAPLGLHPFALPDPGIGRFRAYEQDAAFLGSLSRAAREPATLDAWLDEWVHGCASHAAYLRRLGRGRIAALRPRPPSAAEPPAPGDQLGAPADADETMLVVLAREIARCVRQHGHRIVLAGAGVGATAAFLAHLRLRDEGCTVELLTGNGQFGYAPQPGGSVLASEAGVRSSRMLADTVTAQGVLVGGGHNRCLAVLGAGQVDRHGAINSTLTTDGRFLVGSGGANDALNADEVIVVLTQSRDRFVEQLPYVTGRGDRVMTVVSSLAVLRKPAAGDELRLAALLPPVPSVAGALDAVRAACGWPLAVDPEVQALDAPTDRELALLRWLRDPQGDAAMKNRKTTTMHQAEVVK